jgi:5,10-methylenetetrahydrofolate reductase
MTIHSPAAAPVIHPGCPKRMVFGPCGGVRSDGTCEMKPEPCVFDEPVERPDELLGVPLAAVPAVLTDFSAPPFDRSALNRIVETLAGSCDAVLAGEHQNRPDFPPVLLAQYLLGAGVRPWLTLACRERNRIVLEQELRALGELGLDAVLCVTGDGRGYDVRPDVTQVFDLDGPRLTALATSLGISAAVPETPTAPPAGSRARRLLLKQKCGAAVAVLNHVPDPRDVAEFMAHCRELGLRIPVIAAVAIFTDEQSAVALSGLPGLALDRDVVAGVLGAPDPVAAGIDAAVTEAQALLAIDGIVGVNISGLATGRGWDFGAQIKAEVGRRVRGLRERP